MESLSSHYPKMAVGRILKSSVEAIPMPVGTTRAYLWDDRLKGFGLMVTPKGVRSYLLQYQMGGRGAPTRRYTIGRHGSPWTAEKARERANELLELVRRGVDPVDNERAKCAAATAGALDAARLAFDSYAKIFGEKYVDAKALRSGNDIKSVFRRDLVPYFRQQSLDTIRRSEITDCLDAIFARSPSAAVKAHKWLRKLFIWAVDRGDIQSSPMDRMSPPAKDGQRKRVLKGAELKAVWSAADGLGEPYTSFVRVLLLTAQRLREVAGMNWDEVDLDAGQWVIPPIRTKKGRDHLVPLSSAVVDILRERFPDQSSRKGFVFTTNGMKPINGFSKPKAKLDMLTTEFVANMKGGAISDVKPWVFHDFRRSFGTGCQSMGFPIEQVEAALNHVSGKRGGLVGVYQLWDYHPEKVTMMDAWAKHVDMQISGGMSSVSFRRAARS